MSKKIVLRGSYCLIICLRKDVTIQIGKYASIDFTRGYYVYVGSALNSLESRIRRHLSDVKKLHWHVDYLLASLHAEIVEIVFAVDPNRWECVLAKEIGKEGFEIRGFGCSDCKCSSHLFKFDDLDKSIVVCLDSFIKNYLEPKKLEELEGML